MGKIYDYAFLQKGEPFDKIDDIPIPLVSELLQELDKAMWYCSLDITSGFWVMEMTEREKATSAFVTSLGLFEWLRMHFGLKNTPQIYQ